MPQILLAACMALNLGTFSVSAQSPTDAADQTPTATSAPATDQSAEPGHRVLTAEQKKMLAGKRRAAMRKMGLTPPLIARFEIFGKARLSAYDPAAVLALREEIQLTDVQVKDVEAIAAAMQEQVKAKLTPTQTALLEPIASTPSGMREFCQAIKEKTGKSMMGMMMQHRENRDKKDGADADDMMCCPMMEP